MSLQTRAVAVAVVVGLAIATGPTGPAVAATPHTVQPGETLWSIAAAHNFTTRTVAAFNGLPETATVAAGQTIQVPTVEEGAAALSTAGIAPAPPAPGPAPEAPPAATPQPAPEQSREPVAAPPTSFTAGLGHVPSPYGELHLAPAAAESWNAMRSESLARFGQDLHPAGPVSAHRSYEQQAHLYDLYLRGLGPEAAPPGTSAHESGTAVDLETHEMRWVIDQIGAAYGWGKIEAPGEWWHVNHGG
jgi:LysM repeat protein